MDKNKTPIQTPASPLLQNKQQKQINPQDPLSAPQSSTNPFKKPPIPPHPPQSYQNQETQNPSDPLPPQGNPPPDSSLNSNLDPIGGFEQKSPSFKSLFKFYWQEAITYWSVFWTFGMCVAFLGPTLLDIGCLISSGLATTTWAFTSQLFFSLIGATCSGYVVERIDANLVLFLNTIIIPLTMFFLPFSRSIWSLTAILAVMGLNMGFVDCIANLQMFKVFGESVAPFLHALHFCYGIGAFVSPMISEPYLLNEDCSPFVEPFTEEPFLTRNNQTGVVMYVNTTDFPADTLEQAQEMTQVKYAFWIMAAVQVPVAILVFLLFQKMRTRGWTSAHDELETREISISEKKMKKNEEKLEKLEKSNAKVEERKAFMSEEKQILFITVASAVLLFIYDGLQSGFGGYIYSYALKSIVDLNKTEGAYLTALFWGMFATGRLMSIFLATRFTPSFMLLCNIMGSTVAMTLMVIINHNHVILYLGTGVFGLFLSSVAPSTISMAEQYIDVNSKITSALVVVAALGEMVFPNIVGNLFARVGPLSFLIFCTCFVYLSIIIFISTWIIGRTTPKHIALDNSSFVWCKMCVIDKSVSSHKNKSDAIPMTTTNNNKNDNNKNNNNNNNGVVNNNVKIN